ncbi:MAG: cobalamin-dependent protein [Acidobacteria bacterium]|nr:cobalamin-dependent protein [Acidobacteriota bacterium]
MMIQQNISAPCTVLDFPTRESFQEELAAGDYDIVGISSIVINVGKVREMCRIVRRVAPNTVIVVGGHVTALAEIESMVDADHFVRGDGISWMRRYLGQDENAPVCHPVIVSGFGTRALGIGVPQTAGSTAATIIPSVGCPMGCNFCATSAFFGGKGKFLNFYESGHDLFRVMCQAESSLKVRSFFIMDENFLLYRKRALELLDCLKDANKAWALYVFASANAIRQYSMEELVQLGVSWIWMGLESPRASYAKLHGTDTVALTRELHSHGIKVLGSTIIGLEHHTPENIEAEIEHAVSHETDFHQFMLYTPAPGTPLYAEMLAEKRMLEGIDVADMHGQDKFNFRHTAISREDSKRWLDWAFRRDFDRNGPSLYRICRTTLEGWRRHKDHPDERIRHRFNWEVRWLRTASSGLLWAMQQRMKKTNPVISAVISSLRREIGDEFGPLPRVAGGLLGPFLLWTARREERRLSNGVTYEPSPIVDRRNWVPTGSRPAMHGLPQGASIPFPATEPR